MQPFRYLTFLGVGAFIVLGNPARGNTDPVPNQPQNPTGSQHAAASEPALEKHRHQGSDHQNLAPAQLAVAKPEPIVAPTFRVAQSRAVKPNVSVAPPTPQALSHVKQPQAVTIADQSLRMRRLGADEVPVSVDTAQATLSQKPAPSASPANSDRSSAPPAAKAAQSSGESTPAAPAAPSPTPAQETAPASPTSPTAPTQSPTQSPTPGADSTAPTSGSQTPATNGPSPVPFTLPLGSDRLTQPPYPSLPTPIPVPEQPTNPLPPVNTPPQLGPAKPGRAPEYLNQNANPLQFPTKPEEVRLRGLQPITLRQAIELAERNSRTLQVQLQTLKRTRAQLQEAKAANYPTVTFQTSLTNSNSASGALGAARTQLQQSLAQGGLGQAASAQDPRASSSLNGTLALNYNLFTSGGRPARIRAAERQLRSDELQVEVTREQLRLDVATNYYDLQQADEQVRIGLSSVRNNEISLRDAQAQERAGLGTRFDVLQAEVSLANARQTLTNAIAQQEISRRQLAQRLNAAQTIDIAAADPVAPAGTWTLTLEDSIVLALKNRAELEQFLAQRELSEQQRKAALSALGPQITLSAEYQFANVFKDDLGTRDGYSLSAGLRWNLFDGGVALAQARQQEANIQIAETQFADTRDQIRFAVEQAYNQLVSNLDNIDTTTRAVGQAEESVRLARLRFRAGVGTQLEVLNAENQLTQAEGNRVNAILGYNRALATLLRSISNFRLGDVSPLRP